MLNILHSLYTNQWIWITITAKELIMLLPNVPIVCDHNVTITIAYILKIDHEFILNYVTIYVIYENSEFGSISLFQIKCAENLPDICI
jgi:hypothetical protein